MDATQTSLQAHHWELITHLVLCAHDESANHDVHVLVHRIVQLLEHYLDIPWGMLVVHEKGKIQAHSSWGLSDEKTRSLGQGLEESTDNNTFLHASRIPLRAGTKEVGYLLLANTATNGETQHHEPIHTFETLLSAQVGMLLSTQRLATCEDTPMPHGEATLNDGVTNNTTQQASDTPSIHAMSATPNTIEEHQRQQLHLLYRISEAAVSSQEDQSIYTIILEAIAQATGVHQAFLAIYDRKRGLAPIVATYTPNGQEPTIAYPLVDNPVVDWLDAHQQLLISYDVQQDPLFVRFYEQYHMHAIQSVVVVPLMVEGTVLGCIEMHFFEHQNPLSVQDLEFCQIIAYQAARVIQNRRLITEVQSNAQALQVKVSELSTLLEAARILGSLLKPEEILQNLMDLVKRQLGVSTVALWTLHTRGDEHVLIPAAMDGIAMDIARTLIVPVGSGLTGKVAQTGLPLVVNNVFEDGRSLYPHFNREHHLTGFMGVPIFYHERIIGVLSVMTKKHHTFTTDEMMLLIGLAGQAAVALENARLFQEREKRINELTIINQISSAINATLELDEMLLVLHCGISEVLDTTYSYIGLYDVQSSGQVSILRQRVVRNNDTVHLSDSTLVLDGKGLVDYVIMEGKPLLLCTKEEIKQWMYGKEAYAAPPSSHEQAIPFDVQPQSWLGIPIMHGDEIVGIINIYSTEPYAYSDDDVRFLTTVSSQAAVAIANARLFSERERRLREITVLKDIGGTITSTLELHHVLERLHHELSQAIDVSTSLIATYDEETNTINYPICHDQGQRIYLDSSVLPDDASGWVIHNRQPLLLHTSEQGIQMGIREFGFSVFDVRSGQSGARIPRSKIIQSYLVAPIISGDMVLGVINIQSYTPYSFDDNDLRFLMTVANQLAVTISNVRLFIERERKIQQLATFNEIGQALSSTVSFEDLPLLIYRQTSRLLDTANFYMALYNEHEGEITFPLFYDQVNNRNVTLMKAFNKGKIKDIQSPIDPALYIFIVYLTRRVITQRESLLLQHEELQKGDWNVEIEELCEEVGTIENQFRVPHSWLGVPMLVADNVVGVIGIHTYNNNKSYGPDDVHLLTTIASWAAIAIENARLFDQISTFATGLEQRVAERTEALEKANAQLRQEKEYLQTVHSITMELTSSLNLEEIISWALERVSINLEVSRGSIMLRELQSGKLVCRSVLQDQGVVESADYPIFFNKGEGLVGWVMQTKEPVFIPDVLEDARWIIEAGRADDVRSIAAAPLMTSDTTLGVLILSSPEVNYFTESQVRLLATIANEVAIAINNAQLYGYITEMATRLSELLEQQKEETSKSRAILQSLTEGVIVFNPDQHIELVNWAAEHMLTIDTNAIMNQPIQFLESLGQTNEEQQRSKLLYNSLQTGLQNITDGEDIYTMAIEFINPSQTVAINMAPVVGLDEQSYGSVAVLRDITREIESDRAKREFISNVSHELRTPLTAIKGYVQMLLLESIGSLNESQIKFLTIVKTNANRLMELINDILDMSRIDAGRVELDFTEVDIREVINDALQTLRLEAEAKHLTVNLSIPEDLPPVVADKKRLTQIIFNLFSNSVKYTYDHGHVTMRVFLKPTSMIQVDVEDTGVGISDEQQKQLFSPFFRADNPLRERVSGTGLGLSITKSLVEQHGGEMWVSSEEGKGSTFSFIIPLERPDKSDDETDGDKV